MATAASSVGQASSNELQTLVQPIRLGDFGQVQRLATRRLVMATDEARRTVLMLVADTPETPVQAEKCILYLFELGADPKAEDESGDTAAHLAARRDHLRVLALLPFKAKWLKNKRGATPLMEAARTGGWKCAKHLMHLLRQRNFNERDNSVKSRLLGLKDLAGRKALDLARLSNYSELASDIEREMRLVVGEDGDISGLTSQEEADRKELERLARAGYSASLLRAATRGRCDLPDDRGRTVLLWAAENSECRDEALWERLLQLADPTCADINALSGLHWAADSGNSSAASALLDAGASANAMGFGEFTPLMLSAGAPPAAAAAVSRVLLHAGSDWSRKDRAGRTALDFATRKEKSELAELLRRYEGKKYFDEPLKQLPDFYPVTDPQGFCLIINVCKYGGDSKITVTREERKGSELDVARAKELFERLRFTVIVKEDLTTEEIDNYLNEIKMSKELAKHGSFVCFLMAHGSQDVIYGSNGVPCKIPALTAKFESFVCSDLADKPKIFFIQACRGIHRDKVRVYGEAADGENAAPVRNLILPPARADFLICYATTEGQISYRNTKKGSIFVQTLCEKIDEFHKSDDLLNIMTRVNKHMTENPVRDEGELCHRLAQKVEQLTLKISFDLSKAQRL